jgi:selenide,water dikinase
MTNEVLKSVVLIGGGHSHALVLNALKAAPLQGASVTVINPGKTAPYSGMLPGFVAGHYTRQELDIDLAALCQKVGARLMDGKAIAMDPKRRVVMLDDGTQIAYDIVSVDVGITSRMNALMGFSEFGIPAKPLDDFSRQWEIFKKSAGAKHVAIIGGGIAGVELAMAMAFALREDQEDVSVTLLDRSKILSANSERTQRRMRRELSKSGVDVLEGVHVTEVTPDGLVLVDGASLKANFVVGAAGATPHPWVKETGLALHNGFIEVNKSLETNVLGVFAVGDCAHMTHDPRPKAGVYAVRQAPILLQNIRCTLAGTPLETYAPQPDYLKLVSLGARRAFGEKMGWAAAGHLVWRIKDHIDRRFMNQF